MAAFKTYPVGNSQRIVNLLRHNTRDTVHHTTNPNIDAKKSKYNIDFTPPREETPYQHYKKTLNQYWYLNRADVKTLVEIIVTQPKDLPKDEYKEFFFAVNHYLTRRFGGSHGQYVISSVVHADEGGQPHLHFDFVPIVPDTNPKHEQEFKFCKKQVVNRPMMLRFHDDLQTYLDACGLHANVHSGITKTINNGRGYKVSEIKRQKQEQSRQQPFSR